MLSINEAYQWIQPGRIPPPVFEPEDVESCRSWMVEKNRQKAAVLILGGGSHWFLGNEPARVTDILSTRRWDRILEYNPEDLTIQVESGCPLEKLSGTLQARGQYLPFFPVNAQHATIGGVVATGLSGPYEGALGGPRDYLIGIEALLPEGILSHAGGRVVKNVAGYDLCKLYAGSMGSLGVLTKLTFKLRPRPEQSKTALLFFENSADLIRIAIEVRNAVEPAALEATKPAPNFLASQSGRRLVLALQFLDSAPVVTWKVRRLQEEFPAAVLLDEAEEQRFWNEWHNDFRQALQPENGCSIVRMISPIGPLEKVWSSAEQIPGTGAITGHLRNGVIFSFIEGNDFFPLWKPWVERWISEGVYSILFKADARLKEGVNVWGPVTQPLQLMIKIKQAFDPNNTLNPGRFVV
ncbi:MAG: FAD-binding oxidoreductase [Acidobacteria bacterium]|nr:FAD-binding oxidoreductase [Acidobacteriota bacterium]